MTTRRKTARLSGCGEVDEAIVREARASLVKSRLAEQLARTFKSLSDPTRVRIISVLLKREICVTDLTAVLEMSQSAISHQLGGMREMGLVKFRKEGRHVFYALDDEHVRDLFRQGLAHVEHR
jgi:ArsR family transcriptional regulator